MSEATDSNRTVARHGHSTKAGITPTYRSWLSMRMRCSSGKHPSSKLYFGRGIKVCERWQAFENFLADMGERPEGTTIDRWPDQNGNYEPGNCRWATRHEQSRNTRRNKLTLETAIEVAVMRLRGEKCKVIAAKFGIFKTLPSQIARGLCWPDALEAAKKIVGESARTKRTAPTMEFEGKVMLVDDVAAIVGINAETIKSRIVRGNKDLLRPLDRAGTWKPKENKENKNG
jgi:hypothetical protein